jgi:hypothetical protein
MHLECHSMNPGHLRQRSVINIPNLANQLLRYVFRTRGESGDDLGNLNFEIVESHNKTTRQFQNCYYILPCSEKIWNFLSYGRKQIIRNYPLKRPLGGRKRNEKDNIKMYIRETEYANVDWIKVSQDRIQQAQW